MLTELDINTEEIKAKVLSYEEDWISRATAFPFYTLGRSAYLDGKKASYFDSEVMNTELCASFSGLYAKVLAALSDQLGEGVYMTEDLACPGFHIFRSAPQMTNMAGDWHYDYPHITLGIQAKDVSSFTVAIALPASGGGMDYLDDKGNECHIPYIEGGMLVHSGATRHRISGLKEYTRGEYRITLQGHLIRRAGKMEVFW